MFSDSVEGAFSVRMTKCEWTSEGLKSVIL